MLYNYIQSERTHKTQGANFGGRRHSNGHLLVSLTELLQSVAVKGQWTQTAAEQQQCWSLLEEQLSVSGENVREQPATGPGAH